MRTITFLLSLFCVALSSCNNINEDTNIITNYQIVAKGNLNGSEGISQSNLVITDTVTWNSLYKRINSVNQNITLEQKNINFQHYHIIAVFDETYGNGGHSIDISSIIDNEKNIIVKINKLQSGNFSSVITQPFLIVKISKKDKKIEFE